MDDKFDSRNTDIFNAYLKLRNSIDARCNVLAPMHKDEMQCAKGCSSCCIKYSIFPLEFYYIQKQLENSTLGLPHYGLKKRINKSCVFLENNSCSIYEHRPIICRTQGFPLMYQQLDGVGYEVSACELNFTQFDFSSFNTDNSVFMPKFNSDLYLLNKSFVDLHGKYPPNKRIAIAKLLAK